MADSSSKATTMSPETAQAMGAITQADRASIAKSMVSLEKERLALERDKLRDSQVARQQMMQHEQQQATQAQQAEADQFTQYQQWQTQERQGRLAQEEQIDKRAWQRDQQATNRVFEKVDRQRRLAFQEARLLANDQQTNAIQLQQYLLRAQKPMMDSMAKYLLASREQEKAARTQTKVLERTMEDLLDGVEKDNLWREETGQRFEAVAQGLSQRFGDRLQGLFLGISFDQRSTLGKLFGRPPTTTMGSEVDLAGAIEVVARERGEEFRVGSGIVADAVDRLQQFRMGAKDKGLRERKKETHGHLFPFGGDEVSLSALDENKSVRWLMDLLATEFSKLGGERGMGKKDRLGALVEGLLTYQENPTEENKQRVAGMAKQGVTDEIFFLRQVAAQFGGMHETASLMREPTEAELEGADRVTRIKAKQDVAVRKVTRRIEKLPGLLTVLSDGVVEPEGYAKQQLDSLALTMMQEGWTRDQVLDVLQKMPEHLRKKAAKVMEPVLQGQEEILGRQATLEELEQELRDTGYQADEDILGENLRQLGEERTGIEAELAEEEAEFERLLRE